MNINEFESAVENFYNKRLTFWHGTICITGSAKDQGILTPSSIDLGNAFVKPGTSVFMWKTREEALKWSVGSILSHFQFWLDELKSIKSATKPKTSYDFLFEYDSALKDINNFKCHFWWDRVKKKTITPKSSVKKFNNIIKYFEKHDTGCLLLKLEARAKYVSIGQTATLDEYTSRDPETKIVNIEKVHITRKLINQYCEVVSDEYFNERDAISDAALMNRGILSFFNTNEYDINLRFNDDVYDLRDAFYENNIGDISRYMKENNLKIKKLYPVGRIVSTIQGKKYLKDNYGI